MVLVGLPMSWFGNSDCRAFNRLLNRVYISCVIVSYCMEWIPFIMVPWIGPGLVSRVPLDAGLVVKVIDKTYRWWSLTAGST